MSAIVRVEASGAGRGGLLASGGARLRDRSLGYFTSWRSALLSMVVLAMVVLLLVLDLVGPLFG